MVALARPTAESYKSQYPHTIRRVLTLAVSLHILLFVVAPPFQVEPYRLTEQETLLWVYAPEDPREVVIIEPDEPAAPHDVRAWDRPGETQPTDEVAPEPFPDAPVPPLARPGSGPGLFTVMEQLPELIHFVPPVYPALSKEAGIEGTVVIEVIVSEEGKVEAARVLHSDVTPAMDESAIAAAFKCRFRPARQRNNPVRARVAVPFGFRLQR